MSSEVLIRHIATAGKNSAALESTSTETAIAIGMPTIPPLLATMPEVRDTGWNIAGYDRGPNRA